MVLLVHTRRVQEERVILRVVDDEVGIVVRDHDGASCRFQLVGERLQPFLLDLCETLRALFIGTLAIASPAESTDAADTAAPLRPVRRRAGHKIDLSGIGADVPIERPRTGKIRPGIVGRRRRVQEGDENARCTGGRSPRAAILKVNG